MFDDLIGKVAIVVLTDLDCYLEHIASERSLDANRVLSHLTDDVVFRRYGVTEELQDAQEVRRQFEHIMSSGGFRPMSWKPTTL